MFPTTKTLEEPNSKGDTKINDTEGSIDSENILELWMQDEQEAYSHRIFGFQRVFMIWKTPT